VVKVDLSTLKTLNNIAVGATRSTNGCGVIGKYNPEGVEGLFPIYIEMGSSCVVQVRPLSPCLLLSVCDRCQPTMRIPASDRSEDHPADLLAYLL